MCKVVSALILAFALPAFGDLRADIQDGPRGTIHFEISRDGRLTATPTPNLEQYTRRFWRPSSERILINLARGAQSVVLAPLRAIELVHVKDRLFVAVRENSLGASSYLQEISVSFGRRPRLADLTLPGLIVAGAASTIAFLPADVPSWVVPSTIAGTVMVTLVALATETPSVLKDLQGKANLVQRDRALARVDELVRDGDP